MLLISDDMARGVVGSAAEVAAALACVPGAGADPGTLVDAIAAFAMAQVDDPDAGMSVIPHDGGDPAVLDEILRVTSAWPADRWLEASAWQLVLSAFRIASLDPARAIRDGRGGDGGVAVA